MQKKLGNLSLLLKHIVFLLITYSVCRIFFYWFNYSYFSDLSFGQLFSILLFGIRFDLSVIILTNILFIILYLLPFAFREKNGYRSLLKWLFISVNSIAIFANCIDFAYFQYTFKRTNATIFNFFSGEIGNDLEHLLPLFLKDYWYIFIIGIIFIYIINYFYKTEILFLKKF